MQEKAETAGFQKKNNERMIDSITMTFSGKGIKKINNGKLFTTNKNGRSSQ